MVVGYTTTYALCGKDCQWLEARQWFSQGTPVSSTNKTDRRDIAEIFLKVALNTLTPNSRLQIYR
jgi:hypothetical protein